MSARAYPPGATHAPYRHSPGIYARNVPVRTFSLNRRGPPGPPVPVTDTNTAMW